MSLFQSASPCSRSSRFALLGGVVLAGWLAGWSSQAHATCGDYLMVGGESDMSGHAMPGHGDPAAPGTPCHGPGCSSREAPFTAVPSPPPAPRDPTFACLGADDDFRPSPPPGPMPEEQLLALQAFPFRLLRPPR